jgi:hypothetical protein
MTSQNFIKSVEIKIDMYCLMHGDIEYPSMAHIREYYDAGKSAAVCAKDWIDKHSQ